MNSSYLSGLVMHLCVYIFANEKKKFFEANYCTPGNLDGYSLTIFISRKKNPTSFIIDSNGLNTTFI